LNPNVFISGSFKQLKFGNAKHLSALFIVIIIIINFIGIIMIYYYT